MTRFVNGVIIITKRLEFRVLKMTGGLPQMKKVLIVLLACVMLSMTACTAATDPAQSTAPSAASGGSQQSEAPKETATPEDTATPEPKDAEMEGAGTLGDYGVEIVSARKSKDYENNEAVIVKFKFTNNADETKDFLTSITVDAYQDGVELEMAMVAGADEDYDAQDMMKKIKSGASIECEIGYVMTSESDIELEAHELMSFDSKAKVTKTFAYSDLG